MIGMVLKLWDIFVPDLFLGHLDLLDPLLRDVLRDVLSEILDSVVISNGDFLGDGLDLPLLLEFYLFIFLAIR